MMENIGIKSLRAAVALVLLAAVVFYASSVVGKYRSSKADAAAETTSTVPAVTPEAKKDAATPPADKEGEGETPVAEKETPASGPTVSVKVDGLNFREEPEKNSKVIRGLSAGEKLILIERKDGWFYAEDAHGDKGWLYGSEQYSTVEE